jgi:hypothetical protein
MDKGKVGEEGKGKEMDGCPLTHMVSLHWPQEAARMVFVKLISSLEGVAVGGYEWWWVGIQYW